MTTTPYALSPWLNGMYTPDPADPMSGRTGPGQSHAPQQPQGASSKTTGPAEQVTPESVAEL